MEPLVFKNIDQIIRTKSSLDGAERFPGRDGSGDFKITIENLLSFDRARTIRLGSIVTTLEEITLSATEPYFNLASPSQNLSATNYIDYVPFLRAILAGPRWSSAVLSGTVTLAAGVLTGNSTNFDPELTVGDLVFIEKLNQFRFIATRTSDTAATVDEPGTAAAGARIWKITRAVNKTTTFPITSYQITAANAFSLWMNEGSTT